MDEIKEKASQPLPNPNAAVLRWFKEEEYYWRSLASYVWLAMLLPALFVLFLLVVNVTLFSPVTWIVETTSAVFSLTTISTTVLLQFLCLFASIPHAKALSVERIPHSTNIKFFVFLLQPRQLSVVGLLIAFSFSTTFVLKQYCYSSSDNSLFLSFFGLFIGFFYIRQYYKKHLYVAEFPVVPQTRFFRFKKMADICLRDTVLSTSKAIVVFYLMYFISCLFPSGVLPSLIQLGSDISILSALSVIFNVYLLLDCFCISFVVVALLNVSNTLVKIFNTQAYMFPITGSSSDEANKTLADAMESTDELLKHMACLDYNILSRYQQPRRMELFDLSLPGNQAHCWNRTSKEVLKIIQDMRLRLIQESGRKHKAKFALKPAQTLGSQELFSAPEPQRKMNTSWIPSPGKLLASLTKSPEKKSQLNTSLSATLHSEASPPSQSSKPLPVELSVKSVEPVNVFEKLQSTLWCIEGVSNLAAVSLTEDKYGVVQKKLPEIIGELLLLLEACETYWKCLFNVPSTNHSQHVEAAQMNTTHAMTLKLAAKTGLYTITTAFGYHISSVRLPDEQKKRLHAFLEFTE